MPKDKPRWRSHRGARALKTVAEIEAAIVALQDEDLLDFHDIFAGRIGGVLEKLAAEEMARRNLAA